ncbi:MAG: carbohydrate-binding domain-containing protein [Prevotella sp.]|nr:carbohydrate-binding domain-containing protein [Prevotella sp.]
MKRTLFSLLLATLSVASFSADNHEVLINYQGTTASVDVSSDIMSLVTVTICDANVIIEQSVNVAEEITYRLSGESTNGSFVHTGDYKITLSLEGLQLTSQMGAAIQINNGKRIAIQLKEGTINTLTDMEGGTQKACMVVKGHGEFQGGGTLVINGRGKHAYKGNEYIELKADLGTLTLNSEVKDGLHTDEYVLLKGGTLHITTTGNGYWDEEELKTKAPSCINAVGNVIISGGTINLLSTGDGGKGISTDSCFTMTGGELSILTQGARYIYKNYNGDKTDNDNIPDSLKNSPKAVKAGMGINISGGTIHLSTEQDGGEGLESKEMLFIHDGILHIDTFDDCINAAGNVCIHGGNLFLNSADNDGIDTNQSMYITGGEIITLGSHLHELGIDVNDRSPYKKLYLTGGTVVCIGGTSQITHPYTCEGAQPALYYKGKVTPGTMLQLYCSSDDKEVLHYQLERDYTSEAGGISPELCVMFSSPLLQSGKSYELIDEKTGTCMAIINSLAEVYSYMDTMSPHFSYESFSLGSNTLPYRRADICHNEDDTPILILYLHGGSARGNDNELQLYEKGVSVIYQYLYNHRIPATLIVPQCPTGGGWTGQLRKVVNELMKNYAHTEGFDANRVYVMGGSMGGTGTWAQLSYYPDFYAAAMPVAGNPTGMNAQNVATTPVRTVMGSADRMMSISAVEQFQWEVTDAGGTLILDIEEGWTHQNTCEESYTDARLDWLFSNSRNKEIAIHGDVDGNHIVNVTDVMLMVNYMIGQIPNIFIFDNADIDHNGIIDISDVMNVVNYIISPSH